MHQYLDAQRTVLEHGHDTTDRTGTGTRSHFGLQCRYPLSEGFPLVTTTKLHLRSIIIELLWFLNGDTNIKYLQDNKVSIWDEWADENGDLGPIYGHQWRHWPGRDGEIDQIKTLLDQIRNSPDSRRMVVSAWNPADGRAWRLTNRHRADGARTASRRRARIPPNRHSARPAREEPDNRIRHFAPRRGRQPTGLAQEGPVQLINVEQTLANPLYRHQPTITHLPQGEALDVAWRVR